MDANEKNPAPSSTPQAPGKSGAPEPPTHGEPGQGNATSQGPGKGDATEAPTQGPAGQATSQGAGKEGGNG